MNKRKHLKAVLPQVEYTIREIAKGEVPSNFLMGRDVQLNLSDMERALFNKIEWDNAGTYVISGKQQRITPYDLTAFTIVITQLLYNQSIVNGNDDYNTGYKKIFDKALSEKLGDDILKGAVYVSLNDLCKLTYGTTNPTTEQRKAMETIIDTIHKTPISIKAGRHIFEAPLCTNNARIIDTKTGAIMYDLRPNAFFCGNIKRNFASIPQDVMFRLSDATTKKTYAQLVLIRMLSGQAGLSCKRTIEYLVKECDMEAEYKRERGRAERKLVNTFDVLKEMGVLEGYEVTKDTCTGKMIKVLFMLNPSFKKKRMLEAKVEAKAEEAPPEQEDKPDQDQPIQEPQDV